MDERQRNLSESLHRAWPLGGSGEYVTRFELAEELSKVEANIDIKIDYSAQKQRNWILVGCLAIIITFGGGYVSVISKLDRMNEALPTLVVTQDGRRQWNLYQDQRLDRQDQELHKLNPAYNPMPYIEPPK